MLKNGKEWTPNPEGRMAIPNTCGTAIPRREGRPSNAKASVDLSADCVAFLEPGRSGAGPVRANVLRIQLEADVVAPCHRSGEAFGSASSSLATVASRLCAQKAVLVFGAV